jgi:SAM-dependent methyltransferase
MGQPPPADPTAAPRIFTPEYYARMRDLEDASWWNAGMRDVAARLLALARLPPRGTLIDVGCGSGQTMRWFGDLYPDWRAVGLDVSRHGLLAGARRGIRQLVCGSALELPLSSAVADLVVSLDVLQHLPLDGGDRRALADMRRVLKPGGYLLVRTNAQTFPHTPDDHGYQFHKYQPSELRAALASTGFEVVRLGRVNALLGLAEIPRELRARRDDHSYHGLVAQPMRGGTVAGRMKRSWLCVEGRLLTRGWSLPLGRTVFALGRRSPDP